MDETLLWCDMVSETTVDNVGAKTVSVKQIGNQKAWITVVLAAKANGVKIKPMIVFKGVRKEQALDTIPGNIPVLSFVNDVCHMLAPL